jgi:hypothetical protein
VTKKAGENGKPGTWEEKDSAMKKAAKDGYVHDVEMIASPALARMLTSP